MYTALGLVCLVGLVAAEPHPPFRGRFNRGSSSGGKPGFNTRGIFSSGPDFASVWTATGTVPDKLLTVPTAPLKMKYGNTKVFINDTLDTDQILREPMVYWDADPKALYTLIIEDNDISTIPVKFAHWLVTNIRGNAVATGDVTAAYIPPFDVPLNAEKNAIDKTPAQLGGGNHRYLVLVYKQPGYISVPEGPSGCAPDLLTKRVWDHENLKQDYKLEGPVAGTFFRAGYSRSGWSEFFACKFTRCTGRPFPGGVLPGVNDLPQCQSNQN